MAENKLTETTVEETAASTAAKEKKPAAKKTAAKKPTARKTTVKRTAAKKTPEIIIQSPLGGEITGAEILDRVGKVDKVYVKVDENKAYWVKGEETGSIDLWED